MINIIYDADADCISQIIEYNKNSYSQLVVLPYCVGSDNKKIKFYTNYDPYTSSLLQNNPEFGDYYFFNHTHDYILSDVLKAMEIIELEVKTLDSIVEIDKINIQLPDFLSIDTQGSEYELLLGGEKTLKSSVLGLILEVEFQPLYTGQKLFGDICKLLADNNFEFVKFFDFSELSPYRGSVGLRGDGFQLCSNALFLRKYDSIDPNDENGQIMLNKLAFFSILFNQIEYALLCISRAEHKKLNKKPDNPESGKIKYLTFMQELKYAIKEITPCYPPTFSMLYSYEESRARFATDNQKKTDNNSIAFVKRAGSHLISKSILIKKMYSFAGVIVHAVHWRLLELPSFINMWLFEERYTKVELLFMRYGLTEQAEKVRSVRRKQQKQLYKFSSSSKK
jgi:FkbM family methyltransferase